MSDQVVEFTTDKRFVRRARELKTIEAMVRLYCRGHGHLGGSPLCPECAALFEYATRRLERRVFGDSQLRVRQSFARQPSPAPPPNDLANPLRRSVESAADSYHSFLLVSL